MNGFLLGMILALFMASASAIFTVVKNVLDRINQSPSTIPSTIPTTIIPSQNINTIPSTTTNSLIKLEYSTIYYPACDSTYSSLEDALKSIGEDSSFSTRQLIAQINGILNYSGTSQENTELLDKLKNGKLIKIISSTIINGQNLDTSNSQIPPATVPINGEFKTIPISEIDGQKTNRS